MITTAPYKSPHSSPGVFFDADILDLLSAIIGGENLSVCLRKDGLSLSCPIIVDEMRRATTGLPSCLPAPMFEGSEGNLQLRRSMVDKYLEYLVSIAAGADLRYYYPAHEDLRVLLSGGFAVRTDFTSFIDLSRSDAELLSSMRRSYPSAIKKARRGISVTSFSPESEAAIEEWLALYRIVSTRGNALPSNATENLTKKLFCMGKLRLFGVIQEGCLASAVLISTVQTQAYYWQSATHPEFDRKEPYSHLILWEAVQELRNLGVERLEIGPLQFGADGLSDKEAAISFFKSGLGGTVELWTTLSKTA